MDKDFSLNTKGKIMIEHDGKMYTRVTELLGKYYPMPKIDKDILDRKSKIGSLVHEMISYHFKDDAEWNHEENELSSISNNYFESFLKWQNRLNNTFYLEMGEKRLFSDDFMLTGQIDALISPQDSNEIILIDFKTSAIADKEKWALQLFFYNLLISEECPDYLPDRYQIIQLHPEGDLPHVHEIVFSPLIQRKAANIIQEHKKSLT